MNGYPPAGKGSAVMIPAMRSNEPVQHQEAIKMRSERAIKSRLSKLRQEELDLRIARRKGMMTTTAKVVRANSAIKELEWVLGRKEFLG